MLQTSSKPSKYQSKDQLDSQFADAKMLNKYQYKTYDYAVGTFSMFKIAIHRGWQGIAYLLLQYGYDLMFAIQDAFNERKFRLVLTLLNKTSDDTVILKKNVHQQNLFHIFSKFA